MKNRMRELRSFGSVRDGGPEVPVYSETQWCFVVLWGGFATDVPRAWLLKINYLRLSKLPIFPSLRASNQVAGGSNPSGRAFKSRA
jgi:hypothetical protein